MYKPNPVPPSQADLSILPGEPAGAGIHSTSPGVRGLTAEQRRTGIDTATWHAVLEQVNTDYHTTFTPGHDLIVTGKDMITNLAVRIIDGYWGEQPPAGVLDATWTASGLGGKPTLDDHEDRIRNWLDENPDLIEPVVTAHGVHPDQPSHHVAWGRLEGRIEHDLSGQGREGETWHTAALTCECSATYTVRSNGQRVHYAAPGIDEQTCPYRAAAADTMAQAARERLGLTAGQTPTPQTLRALLDLALSGEWLGQRTSSDLWGSNLYLHTVARVCKVPISTLWSVAATAHQQGLLSLDGAVLTTYRPAAPSTWETILTATAHGVTASAELTSDGTLTVRIINEANGTVIGTSNLTHPPTFGLDTTDVDRLHQAITDACAQVAQNQQGS